MLMEYGTQRWGFGLTSNLDCGTLLNKFLANRLGNIVTIWYSNYRCCIERQVGDYTSVLLLNFVCLNRSPLMMKPGKGCHEYKSCIVKAWLAWRNMERT